MKTSLRISLIASLFLLTFLLHAEEGHCLQNFLKKFFTKEKKEERVLTPSPEIKKFMMMNGEKIPLATLNGKVLEPKIIPQAFYGSQTLPDGIKNLEDIFKTGLPKRGENTELLNHEEFKQEVSLEETFSQEKSKQLSLHAFCPNIFVEWVKSLACNQADSSLKIQIG